MVVYYNFIGHLQMSSLLMVVSILASPFSLWFAHTLAAPYLKKKDMFSFIKVALILFLIAFGIPVSLLMLSLFSFS